jgi:hypothetical protein
MPNPLANLGRVSFSQETTTHLHLDEELPHKMDVCEFIMDLRINLGVAKTKKRYKDISCRTFFKIMNILTKLSKKKVQLDICFSILDKRSSQEMFWRYFSTKGAPMYLVGRVPIGNPIIFIT